MKSFQGVSPAVQKKIRKLFIKMTSQDGGFKVIKACMDDHKRRHAVLVDFAF